MTTYINFLGGPGIGKSTTAAELFVKMKKNKQSVELVPEVAKDFVWEERTSTLKIQPYVTMKQMRNLARLKEKVDFVVTDAPLILGILYARKYATELENTYEPFIADIHRTILTPSVNILLKRQFEYDPVGRYQNEEEANELDADLKAILDEFSIEYLHLTSNEALEHFSV